MLEKLFIRWIRNLPCKLYELHNYDLTTFLVTVTPLDPGLPLHQSTLQGIDAYTYTHKIFFLI